MELKKDGILLINLLFRSAMLIGFATDYESPGFESRNAYGDRSRGVVYRIVLILANGLRDDFLADGATPFLREIARGSGSVGAARIDEIATIRDNLRVLMTGNPRHGSLMSWNRPGDYVTVLDRVTCRCLIGQLPLTKYPDCHRPGRNLTEIFHQFRNVTPLTGDDCLYVISYEFDGSTWREYGEMLRQLDDYVRDAAKNWPDTTWLLTSSRGWTHRDGRVDVPVLAWGRGIRPGREMELLGLADVTALLHSLLGRRQPDDCLGRVPISIVAADFTTKFDIAMENLEHAERALGMIAAQEFELRNGNETVDEAILKSFQESIGNLTTIMRRLRTERLLSYTTVALICYVLWGVVVAVAVSRGSLGVNFQTVAVTLNVYAAIFVIAALRSGHRRLAGLILLTPITLITFTEMVRSFRAEGRRLFVASGLLLPIAAILSLLPNRWVILLLAAVIVPWPLMTGAAYRMNRKILALWFTSTVTLIGFAFLDVIGRDPSPGLSILGSVFHIGMYHQAFHVFRHRIDRQSWIITVIALFSTYVIYLRHLWGLSAASCLVSWFLLLLVLAMSLLVRGTLIERQLKHQLLLLVALQLLSARHEPLYHVTLSTCLFSWVFAERVTAEKSVLKYRPSIFTLECPKELSADCLHIRHYRQILFFVAFSYIAFFAAGNQPTVYTYDLSVLKPFCEFCPSLLLGLKLLIPFGSVVHAFLTLCHTQERDPASLILISGHFSDVIASVHLFRLYVFDEVPSATVQHFVMIQLATMAVIVLYLVQRYTCFRSKKLNLSFA